MTLGLGLRLGGTVLLAAAGWWALLPSAPLAQPAPFNHARHTALACAVCHSGVDSRARATLPPLELCRRCHATAPAGFPEAAFTEAKGGGRFEWKRVTRLPEHVFFSHRRHVASGRLECASCHGDIGQQQRPPVRPPLRLDMDACLSCHRREGISEDCAACHR